MALLKRLLRYALILGFTGILLGALALGVAYWLLAPRLPSVETLRDVQLQVPLRVYSSDGKLLATFGETRRTPVEIEDVPAGVKNAFIAIEDARFYEHPGIDVVGIARAVWLLATTDDRRVPGGSTITQQVARNFFFSSEYSYTRKLSEIFLALRMERELSKDEIFELYLNKIFFGNRAYGVAAAADFYYGKTLSQLSLAESAMLASLPKFPSSGNPLHNPVRAMERRNYVLTRMHEVGFITAEELKTATAEPDHAYAHEPPIEVEAPYVAEMVRLEALTRLGNSAMTDGYVIRTTLDSRLQTAANNALRAALIAYDERHGYRGAEAHVELPADAVPEVLDPFLAGTQTIAGLIPGLVTEVSDDAAMLYLADGQTAALDLATIAWARPYLSENSRGPAPRKMGDVLKAGDIVRLIRDSEGAWRLSQLPAAQGALVALAPEDGALKALSGGFSFSRSKFNRATQSNRQPGSSFKPFIYSAAFEHGFTPASIVNDAPLQFADPSSPDGLWRPQNDDEEFIGPMRLREAMVRSRNLVSVRVLDAIGVRYARDYITRFGFTPESLPENLSLALGTSSVPPLAMARGYSVFANGGFLVEPYFVEAILDRTGKNIFKANPARACRLCPERLLAEAQPDSSATPAEGAPLLAPRVIDERNAYLLSSLMRDVVRRGTGSKAMELGRNDLGGKTGTTNDHRDAWFSGFNSAVAATAWVGFDDFTSLGKGEFASKAALPMWMDFMRVALTGVPEQPFDMPPGVGSARINATTGILASSVDDETILEFFKIEDIGRLSVARANGEQGTEPREAYDIF